MKLKSNFVWVLNKVGNFKAILHVWLKNICDWIYMCSLSMCVSMCVCVCVRVCVCVCVCA